jgi:hypothetical protein
VSDFRPCRECKDWGKCLLTESEKDWFGYQHIRYCPQQIFWLLKYEEIIRGYRWPAPSDMALGGISSMALSDAAFVSISIILAELDYRLNRTSLKGELLSEQCKRRDRIEYLSNNAKDALYYIAGASRKGTPFTVWLAKERYKKYTGPEKCRS